MVVCSGDLTQGRESRVVGDHQRYPGSFVPCTVSQCGVSGSAGSPLDFRCEQMFRLAPSPEMLLEILHSLGKVLLIRANPADSQCHAIWNGSLAVSGVAAVDVEILVCVSWFHMKVSLQVAISDIHSSVQKHY